MKKRLFLFTTIILFIGLVGFFITSIFITHRNNLSIAKSTIIETTQIIAGLYYDGIDLEEFVSVGRATRITVISSEGLVLADNRPMESQLTVNYLSRPEIVAALNNSPAVYVRYSQTHSTDFIYYALKVDTSDGFVFVRASMPSSQIDAYLLQSIPILFALLIVFAVACFFLVRSVTKRILKPLYGVCQKLKLLSDGKYSSEVAGDGYDEISKITKEIDVVALVLQDNFNTLQKEKNKLSYILNSINDGLFVIDGYMDITGINSAALDIFDANPGVEGSGLQNLTDNAEIATAIVDCTNHQENSLFELELDGKTYLVTVKRLSDTELTMVMIADITDKHENAKRREEFFANASHELKTPLTAIKGFNELTSLNNKDDGINKYIAGITRETNRMMFLISDMLKLSELENTPKINPVPVSLSEAINDVCDTVSAAFEEKSITFEVIGSAIVNAEPNHIYDVVKNLVENAARYNKQNGKVSVKIRNNKKGVSMIVSDTGIGISSREQSKIFERFYRVEKSRSIESGGTGLGLSIVKHTCALYGWKLSLKSRLGIGTDITIEFN